MEGTYLPLPVLRIIVFITVIAAVVILSKQGLDPLAIWGSITITGLLSDQVSRQLTFHSAQGLPE
ncbi:hypothetical protein [Actinomadura napierensis]|uniref:hypothetical protein n=1 Tax=Actinomadura napierensis TaxID=267854 RepID=UPI0031D19139